MRLSFTLISIVLMTAACSSSEHAPAPTPKASPTPTPAPPKVTPTPSPAPATAVDENDPLSVRPATSPGEFVSRYANYVVRAKESGSDFQRQRADALAKKSPYASDMLRGMLDSKAPFACNGEDDYIRGCALKTLQTLDAKAALDRARNFVREAKQYCEIERSSANLLASTVPDEAVDAFVARLKADPNLERSDGLLPAIQLAGGDSPARRTKLQGALQQALTAAKDPVAKQKLKDSLAAVKAAPKK